MNIKQNISSRQTSNMFFNEVPKQNNPQIISQTNPYPRLQSQFNTINTNLIENQKAERTRIAFLKDIKKQKKIKIFLKPRSGSFLLNKQRLFYNKFNILKDKTRMYDVFGKFSIVIFERLSLGIVENILLNQPTIFYYPKILYQLKNRHYKDLVYLLKKANIFFDDKKKIQKIINSKKTISKWWLDKKNIKNRNLIIKKYANSFNYDDFKVLKNYLN